MAKSFDEWSNEKYKKTSAATTNSTSKSSNTSSVGTYKSFDSWSNAKYGKTEAQSITDKQEDTKLYTSKIYSTTMSADEYQAEIDRLTKEKNDYSKKWYSANTSKFLAGDEEWAKYQKELKNYDNLIEEMNSGKWAAEGKEDYGKISSNADYAEKSKIIDDKYGRGLLGDANYAYINDVNGYRENSGANAMRSGAGGDMYKYSFMTQQEKDNYNYIYQTEGKKAANEYLDYLSYDLNARQTKNESDIWSEYAGKNLGTGAFASGLSVESILMSGVGLLDVAAQNISRSITGEYKPIDYNTRAMAPTVATTSIRGTVASKISKLGANTRITDKNGYINIDSEEHPIFARLLNGKSLGDVYQLGMSMVDSAATAALGNITGLGAAGTIMLGGSAGSQGVLDAIEKGATDEQALKMGIANGVFEALFEYISIDNLLKGDPKKVITAFLVQGGVEASEEAATTIANDLADAIIMAEKSDWQKNIQAYIYAGLSEEEAKKQALWDAAIGVMWDAVGGFVSGGVMGGGKTAWNNYVAEPHHYRSAYEDRINELVSASMESDPGNNLATEIKDKLDNKKRVSGYKIRDLVQQVAGNDQTKIANAASEQLKTYGETGDVNAIAKAVAKQAAGEELTRSEKKLISSSKYGQRVANELNPDNIRSGEYATDWTQDLNTNVLNANVYGKILQEANAEPVSDATRQQAVTDYLVNKAVEAKQNASQSTQAEATAETTTTATQVINSKLIRSIAEDKTKLAEMGIDPAGKTPSQVRAEVKDQLMEHQEEASTSSSEKTNMSEILTSSTGDNLSHVEETAKDNNVLSNENATVESLSKKYGAQAGAFIHTYQQGQDINKYDEAYAHAYERGKSGVSLETTKGLPVLSYLTEEQIELAYNAGKAASDVEARTKYEKNGKRANGKRANGKRANGKRANGKTGRKRGTVKGEGGVKVADLSKRFNDPQNRAYKILSKIAEATGIDIILFKSQANENGEFVGKEGRFSWRNDAIYIDLNAGLTNVTDVDSLSRYTMLRTFSHEFVHFLEKWNPVMYNEFRKVVLEALDEKLAAQTANSETKLTVDDLIDDKLKKYRAKVDKNFTYEQASREVVADAMTDILPDSKFMENLYNNHSELHNNIVEKLKEFIADLKAYFNGLTINNKLEAHILKENVGGQIKYMESIVKAFDKLAEGGVKNYQAVYAVEDVDNAVQDVSTEIAGKQQYAIRDDAPVEIHKAVTDKNYGGDIRLTDTSPSIMLGHNGVKNLPMLMKASHIRENILSEEEAKKIGLTVDGDINYHGLGEELFKKVIDSLDDITVAYRGTARADDPSRRENCFLLLSTVKDSNGDTIIVPVYINETANYNRVFIKTNKIESVYGKNGLEEYIRKEIDKGNLVRIKKRGPTSSESPAPIAVDYAGVTSAEEAADQTAMASYASNVSQSDTQSQEESQYQIRESSLSDRDVLRYAADSANFGHLTEGERAALHIFKARLDKLDQAEAKRQDLLDQKRELMNGRDAKEITGDEKVELRKIHNNLDTVNGQIRRFNDDLLKVEQQKVIRKIMKQARRVVEKDTRQRGLEELQAYKNKRNDTEAARKYRDRVVKSAMKLSEWLQKNSDKEHVPEVLKNPLLELLTSIDFSSKRFLNGGELTKADKKFGANLAALNKLLEGQQGAIEGNENAVDNIGAYIDLSAENRQFLKDMVTAVASVEGTFTINRMTSEELRNFAHLLENLSTAIRKANATLANARYQSIPAMAQDSMQHMEDMGNAKTLEGTKIAKFLQWKNATPYYAFKRFGAAGKALFEGFTKGWEKLALNAKEIIDFTKKTYTAKEVREWRKQIHEIELEDGSKIKMTTPQIMELTMSLKREQAMKHIVGVGIRLANIKKKIGSSQDTNYYKLTLQDMAKITNLLTERQLEVAQKLQKYMAQRGGEWGNEISMARFGYEFYTEGDSYYPIKTDDNSRPMADTDAQNNSMFRLLNLSSSKSLNPHANNALVVGDIFDTFSDHMSDMAKLNAMGLPILDAIKWFNYRERMQNPDGTINEESLKKSMENAFGTAAGSYFRTLIKDINGVKESGDRTGDVFNRMLSNYKVAAVAANLRVALLQPTSYVRAMFILKPKHMISALAFRKNAYNEAVKYSGTAVWKSLGYYDTDIARSMRSQIEHDETWMDKVKEKSMVLAELGDQRTWGRLWVACKLQAKENNPGLTGEDLCKATADLFREVIYATQVMDSTLTRSTIMRGTTRADKMTSAFMAEPTLSANILMDAASQYAMDMRKSDAKTAWQKNKGKIALAMTTYVCSAAAAALIESLWDAFRDDDDYETLLQKFSQAFWGEEGFFSGNFGQDLTIIGKIPELKDILSTLKGDKKSDMSITSVESVVNAFNIWKETIQLANGTLENPTKTTYNGKMTPWGKIYKTLQALSQTTGLAVSNLTRDVVAIWNTTIGALDQSKKIKTYDAGAKNSIKSAYQNGYFTEDEAIAKLIESGEAGDKNEAYWIVNEWDTGSSKYEAISEAIKSNDMSAYTKEMSNLTNNGVKKNDVYSKARTVIGDLYKGTDKEPATISKSEAITRLISYGDMDRDEAEELANKWQCKVDTGIGYTELKDYYDSGDITYSQAVSYMKKYGGKNDEEATETAELWKFKAGSDKYEDISAEAVAKYNEYCADTGMSKDTYYSAWSEINGIQGEDLNGDGKNDAYTAMDKKLRYIGSLNISNDQKTALALASGISEKNINKRAHW